MEELPVLEILIRLIVAGALSAAIGYERELHHKPAGMRTYVLVGIGTTVMTIASIEIAQLVPDPTSVDISRIASTILPGVGFLGAGTIIQGGGTVKGLTTAAGIWMVAAIGMVSGMGFFHIAFIATIFTLITLVVLGQLQIENTNKPR